MRTVDVVLVEGFPILSLALVTEPLRVANRERLRQVFVWRLLSAAGGAVRSSSGLVLETAALENAETAARPADAVALLASYGVDAALEPTLLAWLRRRAREGALMGCVDTGARLFAAAGLLSRRPAAVHFEAMASLAAEFPDALFLDRLMDFTPPRFSSAGGVATVDATLALIAHFEGSALARRVAEVLTYWRADDARFDLAGAEARFAAHHGVASVNAELAGAVEIMLDHLSAPLPVSEVAARAGAPPWRLTRLFRRHLRASPSDYYRHLRLARARDLLRNSRLPVGVIASQCGFDNPESFSRAYRRAFGAAPSADRAALDRGGAP